MWYLSLSVDVMTWKMDEARIFFVGGSAEMNVAGLGVCMEVLESVRRRHSASS
jgi:hypothetical protein